MRKKVLVYIMLFAFTGLLTACGKAPAAVEDPSNETANATSVEESADLPEESDESADAALLDADTGMSQEEPTPVTQEPEDTDTDDPDDEQEARPGSKYISGSTETDNTDAQQEQKKDIPDIVWIGDSLTQGSLGDDNHNQNNPQAPWRVLGEISGLNVAGAGFYGYTTHDIFWAYGEYNGIKDPDITYIYWVGSNDFYQSPDNIGSVIEEIDHFNANAGITDFLVLGTTNRHDMDPNAYIPINKTFEETYKDKYLDIMPYVEYGPDGIHLTEASYAAIARAVYDKLK